jgi:hypothetical protein
VSRSRLAWVVLAPAIAAAACKKEIADPIGRDVDPRDPKSVVGAVIYAARTGDAAPLAGLCAPGVSEASVAAICALAPEAPAWPSFRAAFGRARLNGEPRIHGDHAALNFVFGPDGATPETMELARVDGRWHLLRF